MARCYGGPAGPANGSTAGLKKILDTVSLRAIFRQLVTVVGRASGLVSETLRESLKI
jgi:hypothetical protein